MTTNIDLERGRLVVHSYNLRTALKHKEQLKAQMAQIQAAADAINEQILAQDITIATSILESKDQVAKLVEAGTPTGVLQDAIGGDVFPLVMGSSTSKLVDNMQDQVTKTWKKS